MVEETINVRLKLLTDQFTKPMRSAEKQFKQQLQASNALSRGLVARNKKLKESARTQVMVNKDMSAANMRVRDVMRLSGDQFKDFSQHAGKMNSRMAKGAFAVRNFAHGMRGFKMEMLGVMFFGMSMNRMFMGLLKPSLEMTGALEVLSAALGLLFLPLALKVLDWSIKFLKWVTKLTKKQKKWINIFVAIGIVVGTLLMLFGTLVLGLGSLMLAFHFLFSPIGLVISALVTLGGFAFLVNMFKDTGDAVEYAEGKLLAFGVSAESIGIVKDRISELLAELSTMKEKWTFLGESIASGLMGGIVNYFKNNPMTIVGAIAGGLLGGPAGVAIGAALGTLFKKVKVDEIEGLLKTGLRILDELIQGILDNLDKLELVVEGIAYELGQFVEDHLGDFINIGWRIAKAILKGFFSVGIIKDIFAGFSIGAVAGTPAGPAGMAIGGAIGAVAGAFKGGYDLGADYKKKLREREEERRRLAEENSTIIWTPEGGAQSSVIESPSSKGLGTSEMSVTNIFNGFTMEDLNRELDERDRNIVSQMEASR